MGEINSGLFDGLPPEVMFIGMGNLDVHKISGLKHL
jgi:hypothetical protein